LVPNFAFLRSASESFTEFDDFSIAFAFKILQKFNGDMVLRAQLEHTRAS
jgi:hypothetical protein